MPETRLRQRFLNNLGLHTCCTEIILHCVSVSNQLQQWTNFCTNFSPEKWGEWGTRPPVEKKCVDAVPPRPCPTTPLVVSDTAPNSPNSLLGGPYPRTFAIANTIIIDYVTISRPRPGSVQSHSVSRYSSVHVRTKSQTRIRHSWTRESSRRHKCMLCRS